MAARALAGLQRSGLPLHFVYVLRDTHRNSGSSTQKSHLKTCDEAANLTLVKFLYRCCCCQKTLFSKFDICLLAELSFSLYAWLCYDLLKLHQDLARCQRQAGHPSWVGYFGRRNRSLGLVCGAHAQEIGTLEHFSCGCMHRSCLDVLLKCAHQGRSNIRNSWGKTCICIRIGHLQVAQVDLVLLSNLATVKLIHYLKIICLIG